MKRQILLGVVVVALTVIGCSSAATPLPTPAPAPMAFPTGTFTMQLGNHQWTMLLGENGNCTLVEDDVIVSTGVYKVTGDQLEWVKHTYCAAQGAERGTYTWSFDGKVLTFKPIQDGCADRKAWLDNIQWTRKP
jgi:hypothetical protein